MIRVVLDANQFVSAILKPESNPAKIISLVRVDKVKLLLSDDIIAEISGVLLYPKIKKRHGKSEAYIKTFMKNIRSVGVITEGKLIVDVIEADPSDNKYLACALEGHADFIISGDNHLRMLKSFRGIQITDPATFLKMLEAVKTE